MSESMIDKWKPALEAVPAVIGAVGALAGLVLPVMDKVNAKTLCVVLSIILALMLAFFIWRMVSLKQLMRTRTDEILQAVIKCHTKYSQALAQIENGTIDLNSLLSPLLAELNNCIEELLRKVLDKDICVCIKMIDTESVMDENVNEWRVRTIGRSQATQPERLRSDMNKSVFVRDNSDFYDIASGRSKHFAIPDLSEHVERGLEFGSEYKNTTQNYSKYYKSTIVFPISAPAGGADRLIVASGFGQCGGDYHLLGFLCADSLTPFKKDDSSFLMAVGLVQSFAGIIYSLLERYILTQFEYIEVDETFNEPASFQNDVDER